jgi:hypothetical protein
MGRAAKVVSVGCVERWRTPFETEREGKKSVHGIAWLK